MGREDVLPSTVWLHFLNNLEDLEMKKTYILKIFPQFLGEYKVLQT